MNAIDAVSVVIPARDEERRIAAALDAVLAARHELSGRAPEMDVHVVVVDDASTDGTADVVRRWRRQRDLDVTVAHGNGAGSPAAARNVGVAAAARSTAGAGHRPWSVVVASTDADTVVRPGWLVQHVEWHEAGERAVTGIVDLLADDATDIAYERWATAYRSGFGAGRHHPHVHAANLSVRLDALIAVGLFGDVRRAEDIDLWRRLALAGVAPMADSTIVVDTSARSTPRVEMGFGGALGAFRLTGAAPTDRRSA